MKMIRCDKCGSIRKVEDSIGKEVEVRVRISDWDYSEIYRYDLCDNCAEKYLEKVRENVVLD